MLFEFKSLTARAAQYIRLIHRISRASTLCTKSRYEHVFGNNIRWPLRLGKGLYKPLTITAEDIEI